MRHKIAGNTLNRKTSHRKATVRDIAKATLIKQRICTTKAKAKEARKLVDQLITLGKKDTLAARRRAFAILCDHKLVSNLFKKTSPRFKSRTGGYTRIIPYRNRRGDNAQLAFLELTEIDEALLVKPKKKPEKAKKTPKAATAGSGSEKAPEKGDSKEKKIDFSKVSEQQHASKDDVKSAKKKSIKEEKSKPKDKLSGIKKFFKRKTD